MEEKRTSIGKTKIVLGGFTLLIIFSTPYLNITTLSLNLDLFQSALYSSILLGFWLIAGSILRTGQKTTDRRKTPRPDRYHHMYHKPVITA